MKIKISILTLLLAFTVQSYSFMKNEMPFYFLCQDIARAVSTDDTNKNNAVTNELIQSAANNTITFIDGVLSGYVASFGQKASDCYYKYYAESDPLGIEKAMVSQYEAGLIDKRTMAIGGIMSIIKSKYPMPKRCQISDN